MEGGLDHDDGVAAILSEERVPEEGGLVRGAVEDLQELRPGMHDETRHGGGEWGRHAPGLPLTVQHITHPYPSVDVVPHPELHLTMQTMTTMDAVVGPPPGVL